MIGHGGFAWQGNPEATSPGGDLKFTSGFEKGLSELENAESPPGGCAVAEDRATSQSPRNDPYPFGNAPVGDCDPVSYPF
jgi:hypothetical protein